MFNFVDAIVVVIVLVVAAAADVVVVMSVQNIKAKVCCELREK